VIMVAITWVCAGLLAGAVAVDRLLERRRWRQMRDARIGVDCAGCNYTFRFHLVRWVGGQPWCRECLDDE